MKFIHPMTEPIPSAQGLPWIACTPGTVLPVHTVISMRADLGTVIDSGWATDQHGQPICTHTVRITHKYDRNVHPRPWRQMEKPIVTKCNYAFISYQPI